MSKQIIKLHNKLARFKASVDKRAGALGDLFVEPSFKMEYINTGSTVLNMLIGGSRLPDGNFVCPGYPRGRISEVYGRESSGKSTLALSGMAQAIFNGGKNDGCGFYVDLECAVVDKYSMSLGVDFRPVTQNGSGQALRAQPRTFEEAEALVTNAALNGVDFIVIDSVAGLISTREVKRDTVDVKQKQGVAEIPRLMSNWLPKLQNIISRTGSHVMFLNQTRDKIGAMGYTEEALKSTTGGNALKFWASIRLLLKPKMSTKAKRYNPIIKAYEEVQIATDIEVKMIKNKVDAKQGHSGLITIRYGVGIDELRTLLNVAEAYNIARLTKNAKKQEVWQFKSQKSGKLIEQVGIEKFRLALKQMDDGALLQELSELCMNKIVEGYELISDEELASLAEGAVSKRNDDDDDYEASDAPVVEIDEQTDTDDAELPDPVGATSAMELLDSP